MAVTLSHRVAAMRRYPVVLATVAVGISGALLWLLGLEWLARWEFGIFALVAAAIEARPMIASMRRREFGVDLLAVIAIVSTVAVGEVVASLIIVLMVSGGKALEDYAESRAKSELTALLQREPRTAHRVLEGSRTETVPATSIAIGELILVRSGEVVPVDGILDSESGSFDTSSLTGESMPVELGAHDEVLSGSVAGGRAVTILASRLARDSQYQSIIGLVKQAAENRAPVVRLADRYALPFTIVSLTIAIVAWVASGDPVRFAEVLVLATPCPLVLAAPVAFMGGMSRSAHQGIIVKGGGVLEQLSRIRTVVFDKTGTLTVGRPTIVGIAPLGGMHEDELLMWAASAEQVSSHVLASSIVAEARARGLELRAVDASEEVDAAGVEATFGGVEVALGTLRFIRQRDSTAESSPGSAGEVVVYIAIDGRAAGSIRLADPVRSETPRTLASLRAAGVDEIVMLSGDAHPTAERIAGELGITEFRADCLPADKVRYVSGITRRPVLMIGDGVNDAPVLAAADVGIALGARGATSASESAAAVILVDDLSRVATAIQIGKATVRVALQSIWIGIGLCLVLMSVAAFGVIPATIGAATQEVVDLIAILNALRAIGGRRNAVS